RARLQPGAAEPKAYTRDSEAYQDYLRGRYFWNKRTEDGFPKAVTYFSQAIERDPTYALAYSGLADTYALMSDYSILPPNEAMPKARAAAERALALDPQLAEAHTSLAFVRMAYDWKWDEAGQEFQRAIELNPNYATAHQWYASYLVQVGRFGEALSEIRHAQELDPLASIISANAGRYASPYFVAIVYTGLGDRERAFDSLERAYQDRHPGMILLKYDPRFDPLRGDPRFTKLIRRIEQPS